MTTETLQHLADRIHQARASGAPIPPIRDELAAGGLPAAYSVQRLNIDRLVAAGAVRIGRKIGLTSKAVQAQLGVDSPDFGILLDTMAWRGNEVSIPVSGMIAPRIEAEIAFILGADIAHPMPSSQIANAVSFVAASAEIVDSAIADWSISILDTVADNASSARFALGSPMQYEPGMDLASRRMSLRMDGQTMATGIGAATLGDPLTALEWLAEAAIAVGDPLRAGEIILAGALGPMTPFKSGTYEIEIDGFPALTVTGTP